MAQVNRASSARKSAVAPNKEFVIPDTPTFTVPSLESQCLYFYGEMKWGKSRFESEMRDIFILDFEGGLGYLKTRDLRIRSWQEYLNALDQLEKAYQAGTFKCGMWGFDTVDNAYKFCYDHVCSVLNISHPGDMSHGRGWDAIKQEWATGLARLLGMIPSVGCCFVGHSKEISIDLETPGIEEKVVRILPAVPKTALMPVNAVCSLIAYCGYSTKNSKVRSIKNERVFWVRPTEHVFAGGRMGEYLQNDFIPYGNGYDDFKTELQDALDEMTEDMED